MHFTMSELPPDLSEPLYIYQTWWFPLFRSKKKKLHISTTGHNFSERKSFVIRVKLFFCTPLALFLFLVKTGWFANHVSSLLHWTAVVVMACLWSIFYIKAFIMDQSELLWLLASYCVLSPTSSWSLAKGFSARNKWQGIPLVLELQAVCFNTHGTVWTC